MRTAFVIVTLGVAICAGFVAVAEQAPASGPAQAIAGALPLANPRLTQAEEIATDPKQRRVLITALKDTAAATTIAPDRLRAVLVRLDAVTTAHNGAMSPEGLTLLSRSYDLSPLDYSYSIGRLQFAYNHWTELTPQLRERVFTETACLRMARTEAVDALPLRTANRAGALAAALNLRRSWHIISTCHPNA